MSGMIERYHADGTVDTLPVAPPPNLPPSVSVVLSERIAELEARLAGVDADRLARIEAKLTQAAGAANAINPAAVIDAGTRGELVKVKDALAEIAPDEEVTP